MPDLSDFDAILYPRITEDRASLTRRVELLLTEATAKWGCGIEITISVEGEKPIVIGTTYRK